MTADEINETSALLHAVAELLFGDYHCRYRGQGRLDKRFVSAIYHVNREPDEVILGDVGHGGRCEHPEGCRTAERFRDWLASSPLAQPVRSRTSALAS